MKKTYKKVITNKYYAIRYWNTLCNNEAIQWCTMGKEYREGQRVWVIEWCYR